MLYLPVPRLSSYQQRCALPSHIIDTQPGSTHASSIPAHHHWRHIHSHCSYSGLDAAPPHVAIPMQPALRYRQLPPSTRAHIALNPALWARMPLRRHLDVTGAAASTGIAAVDVSGQHAVCLSRSRAWLQSSL